MSPLEIGIVAALIVGVLFLGPTQLPKLAKQWRKAADEIKKAE